MIEADDGRLPPGLGATLPRLAYEPLILPVGVGMYNRHQQRAKQQQAAAADGGGASRRAHPGLILAVALIVGVVVAGFLLARQEEAR